MAADPLSCGSAPLAPCVEGGGCDQLRPLQARPCPTPTRPSRTAGGRWAEKPRPTECPAVTLAAPDESRHLGVPIPPTKETETERHEKTEKKRGRQTVGVGERSKSDMWAERWREMVMPKI